MRKFLVLGGAIMAALPFVLAGAAIPERPAVEKAVNYIRTTQQADGGFGGFGDGQSFDAIYAVRAAGLDPATFQKDGKSPVDFLRAKAAAQKKPAEAAKAALAARATGVDPKAVGGVDLLATVAGGLDKTTNRYATDDFSNAIAILGLACTGNTVPVAAVEAMKKTQLADGGWGFGGASDPDTAAISVQALLAAKVPVADASVAKTLAYFKATQAKDGGWGFDPEASSASSTAFVVQALIAANEPVEGAAWTKSGKTAVTFLLSQQKADGSFEGFDPAFAANQVVPALAGRTFCNAPGTAIGNPGPIPPPTATATASPSPSASPTATATPRAPEPPRTGTGVDSGTSLDGFVLAGLALLAATGAGLAATRRR
ncbi:MAG: prenyltransferase/squalene oxidase repeat-containing protein [Dehalococcoidia bacterium]